MRVLPIHNRGGGNIFIHFTRSAEPKCVDVKIEYQLDAIWRVVHYDNVPKTDLIRHASSDGQSSKNVFIMHIGSDDSRHTYMWIGMHGIRQFITNVEIVMEHYGLVYYIDGERIYSHPWLKDTAGNYYLLCEEIVLTASECLEYRLANHDNPYEYFYANRVITGTDVNSSILATFNGLVAMRINEKICGLVYQTSYEIQGANIMVFERNYKWRSITIAEFVEYISKCGDFAGFKRMEFVNLEW